MTVEREVSNSRSLPAAIRPLIDGIKGSYHTKVFADLTIKHERSNETWKVHKLVICSQSEQLKATLETGAELEGKAEKNEITLDDDPQAIEAMLNYLYTSDYGDFGNSQVHVSSLVLDVRVFVIADKYFIAPLADLAAEKFSSLCRTEWSTPAFADAIKEIYTTAPEHDGRLKRTVIDIINDHTAEIFHDDNQANHAAFHQVLNQLAELGADVSKTLAVGKAKSTVNKYRCPKSGEIFEAGLPLPAQFGCPRSCHTSNTPDWWSSYLVSG